MCVHHTQLLALCFSSCLDQWGGILKKIKLWCTTWRQISTSSQLRFRVSFRPSLGDGRTEQSLRSPFLNSFSPPTHTQPTSVQTCWIYCSTWQPRHHFSSSSRSNTRGSGSSLESLFKPELPPLDAVQVSTAKHLTRLLRSHHHQRKKKKKRHSKWFSQKAQLLMTIVWVTASLYIMGIQKCIDCWPK